MPRTKTRELQHRTTSPRPSRKATSTALAESATADASASNAPRRLPKALIPVHADPGSFVYQYEIPRKTLHVSVGFLTLVLYGRGYQTSQIHPVLLTALIPIAAVDVLRHRLPALNHVYVRACGLLMRESEVDGYNGVIWYLSGAWAVLRFCPKDVGVVSVLLLSWCDTAASTLGRAWGHHTWALRQGKTLAGSAGAFIVGVMTAWGFWGLVGPMYGVPEQANVGPVAFAFRGCLELPVVAKHLLGLTDVAATVNGTSALGLLSIFTGLVASASEALDMFGLDDNLTIPVLCGAGLWGFLKVFGSA